MQKEYKYKAVFRKTVKKFLSKHKWERIIYDFQKTLSILKNDPFEISLDIKTMRWREVAYRLRISKYRFIYEVIENDLVIHFVKADKRGDIYK